MGRIKTASIKRVSIDLFKEHSGEFKENFENNKKLLEKFANIKSKKIRNIVAGYITRLKRGKREAS